MAAGKGSRRRRREPLAGPIIQGNIYEQNNQNENGIPEQRYPNSLKGENATESRKAGENNANLSYEKVVDADDPFSSRPIEPNFALQRYEPSVQASPVPAQATRRLHHRKKRRLPYGQVSPETETQPFSSIARPPAGGSKTVQGKSDQDTIPIVQESDAENATTSPTHDNRGTNNFPPQEPIESAATEEKHSSKVYTGHPNPEFTKKLQRRQHRHPTGFHPLYQQRLPTFSPTPRTSVMHGIHGAYNERATQTPNQGKELAFILPTPQVGFPEPLLALPVRSPQVPVLPPIQIPPAILNSQPPTDCAEVLEDRVNGIDNKDITSFDVLRGKGDNYTTFRGNKIFRRVVNECFNEYQRATARGSKRRVAKAVVAQVRSTLGGRFLEFDGEKNLWFEIGDEKAINKVLTLFRDIVKSKKKMENPALS